MKNFVRICLFLAIFSTFVLSGCNNTPIAASEDASVVNASTDVPVQNAEKIIVVHFHGTQQCWSCIKVGELALKTIKEKFPQEYENGTIIFKEINGELPENHNTVMKYQARGSSLFVNAIVDGSDNISEDITVWRLISDENKFMNYFQNKLNKLLGK